MNRRDRAWIELSIACEPGDPRVFDELREADHDVERVVARHRSAESERLTDLSVSLAASSDLRWVGRGSAEWPVTLDDLDHVEPLNNVVGAPWGLWVRGTGRLDDLGARGVSVVGARSCSSYGAEVAAEMAADLGDAGLAVVSGAAYGIDACAHRGAMAMRRPTIAVLASGADRAYPLAHTQLLERIATEGGLVISEQPPGMPPQRHRFLSRNRIIAALSHGTVVVEAARRSGSLNTLNWADRLGRATMVVPGPVTSVRSVGSHAAVRDGKAVLVTSGQDVIDDLRAVGVVLDPSA